MTVASLFAELGVDTSPMTGVARDVRKKLQPLSKTFTQVGQTLTKDITVPLAGAAAAATKTGTAIDKQFSRIEGLVGESRSALQGMRGDLLKISTATARGPEELAKALFFVESAGFRGAEAMSVLEASAKASAAGLGRTKDVADAVTSVVNAYGSDAISASEATDVLTATVREGKVAADTLATSLGRVIPVAAEMGVGFREVGGTIATLTRLGASSNRAVTALSATLRQVLKPTKQMKEGLDKMGLSVNELQKIISQRGLLPALQLLNKRFEETDVRMTDVFSNARALRGVLGLIGQSANQAENIFASMNNEVGGSTQKAFEAATNTIRNRFWRAVREVQAILDRVFRTFKGPIKSVLDTLNSTLDSVSGAWDNLSSTAQNAIVITAGVAAAIGPLLTALGGLLAIAPALAGAFTGAVSALSTAAPIIASLGAVAVAVYQEWDNLVRFFTQGAGADLWTSLQTAAQETWDVVKGIFASMGSALQKLWKAFKELVGSGSGIGGLIGTRLVEAFEFLSKIAVPIMNQIGNVVGFLANSIARAVQFIVNILTGDFAGAWQNVKDQLGAVKRFFLRTLANITDALISFVEHAVNAIPGVDVAFDDARQAVRRWRESIEQNTKKARHQFSATMETAKQVSFEQQKMGDSVKNATDKAAKGAKKMGDAMKTAGEKAQEGANKASDAANKAKQAFQDMGVASLSSAQPADPAGTVPAQGESEGDQQGQQGEGAFGGAIPDRIFPPQKKMTQFQKFMRRSIQSVKKMGGAIKQNLTRGLANAITKGRAFGVEINSVQDAFKALGNFASQIINQIIQKLIQAALQSKALKGALSGGPAGAILTGALAVGGIIRAATSDPDGRAAGGPVSANETYVVGEGGEPELFTPSKSGQVTPMSKLGGGKRSTSIVQLQPEVLPNGDLRFAVEEGDRQDKRRGFPDEA